MPKSIEKQLTKRQWEFLWDSKSSAIQKEMMQAPILEGGKNLFDLAMRNEALELMKLKLYGELDPEIRATWAKVADRRVIRSAAKSTVQIGSHVSMLTQGWHPTLYKLPAHLKKMLTIKRKYGTNFDTHEPTREIRERLPLWHHFGENANTRQLNNKPQGKCLRRVHKVHKIGEGFRVMDKLYSNDHSPNAQCECADCTEDFEAGCRNPHACAVAVRE
jgi:hypothetical protein